MNTISVALILVFMPVARNSFPFMEVFARKSIQHKVCIVIYKYMGTL